MLCQKYLYDLSFGSTDLTDVLMDILKSGFSSINYESHIPSYS